MTLIKKIVLIFFLFPVYCIQTVDNEPVKGEVWTARDRVNGIVYLLLRSNSAGHLTFTQNAGHTKTYIADIIAYEDGLFAVYKNQKTELETPDRKQNFHWVSAQALHNLRSCIKGDDYAGYHVRTRNGQNIPLDPQFLRALNQEPHLKQYPHLRDDPQYLKPLERLTYSRCQIKNSYDA